MFSLLYLQRARIPRAAAISLWAIVALNFMSAIGSDLYQDLWPVPDVVTRVLIVAMGLGFVLLGVAGLRRKVEGSIYYLIGAALAVFGLYVGSFADYLWRPLVEAAPMIGSAIEALLLALAVSLQLRRQEREREHLDRLAHADGLTGIANRTALDARLARSWERARRASEPLAALMIDVDHFKQYNDTYGHQAGDEVLRHIARVISDLSVRRDDIVARYGGEEFFVMLAETDLAGAHGVADRLLVAINALALPHAAMPEQRVTVSIGVASIVPDGATDERELIRRADAALYAAKQLGRNRLALDTAIVA
jgi:diguanylate cyclase (GGDEF)-like protein